MFFYIIFLDFKLKIKQKSISYKNILFENKDHMRSTMKIKLILLGLITFIVSINIDASENIYTSNYFDKFQEFFTQSIPVQYTKKYLFSPVISARNILHKMHDGPASNAYQKLGEEAQRLLGIKQIYWVPIKKSKKNEDYLVSKGYTQLYINEDALQEESHGTKKLIINRELASSKYGGTYGNMLMGFVLSSLSADLAFNLTSFLLAKANIDPELNKQISFGSKLISFILAGLKYNSYCTHRTNIEAIYATNCAQCVNEIKEAKSKDTKNFDKYTNLSIAEIEKAKQNLEKNKRICSYHWNQKNKNIQDLLSSNKESFTALKQIKEVKNILPKLSYYKQLL